MFNLSRAAILFIILGLILAISFPMGLYDLIHSTFQKNDVTVISITSINPYINTICASKKNNLYIKTTARHKDGSPFKYASVSNTVNGPGKVIPKNQLTDANGEAIFYYEPDSITSENKDAAKNVEIRSTSSKAVSNSINLTIIPEPVILVHGYREKAAVFNNLKNFLSDKGITSFAIDYDSTIGIESSSKALSLFIGNQEKDLFSKGILSNGFTIISHSFGGLVSRYYTASQDYFKMENIDKMIFLSVPHNGTDIALIGENFYNDQTIKDLTPGNYLFYGKFPSLINKGLNSNIQIANILGQYDEVVTPDSASLSDWKIDTSIYNVGEDVRTFDNILKGNIVEAPIHNSVLNNQKIFQKILDSLSQILPYPQKIS